MKRIDLTLDRRCIRDEMYVVLINEIDKQCMKDISRTVYAVMYIINCKGIDTDVHQKVGDEII